MNRKTFAIKWVGTAVALAWAGSVVAPAQSGSSTNNATPAAADKKPITVVGCVQNFSSSDIRGETQHGFLLSNATSGDPAADPASRGTTPSGSITAAGTDAHAATNTPAASNTPAATNTPAGSNPPATPNPAAATNTGAATSSPTGTSGTAPSDKPTSSAGPTTPGALAHPSARGNNYRLEGAASELKEHVGHKVEVTGTVDPRSDAQAEAAKNSTEPRLTVTAVRMIASDCAARP